MGKWSTKLAILDIGLRVEAVDEAANVVDDAAPVTCLLPGRVFMVAPDLSVSPLLA